MSVRRPSPFPPPAYHECAFCAGTGRDTFVSEAADGELVTFTCWVCGGSGNDAPFRASMTAIRQRFSGNAS